MAWLEASLAAAGVLVADQISKHLVLARARYAAPREPTPFFAIRCIVNRRGTLVARPGRPMTIAAFGLCIAVALVLLAQEPLSRNVPTAAGLGLALGGIAGNFIDLMRRGGMVDFIAVGPLPVSNIADWAIVGGLALALTGLL